MFKPDDMQKAEMRSQVQEELLLEMLALVAQNSSPESIRDLLPTIKDMQTSLEKRLVGITRAVTAMEQRLGDGPTNLKAEIVMTGGD